MRLLAGKGDLLGGGGTDPQLHDPARPQELRYTPDHCRMSEPLTTVALREVSMGIDLKDNQARISRKSSLNQGKRDQMFPPQDHTGHLLLQNSRRLFFNPCQTSLKISRRQFEIPSVDHLQLADIPV